MLFNSIAFAIFLPLVFTLYWLARERRRQNWILLVAGYYFYGVWDWRFLLLIWLTTIMDFLVGLWLGATTSDRRRRGILLISLALNLGMLAIFKYYDFFVESAMRLMTSVGLEPNPPLLHVILPVGISFYTFQSLSYTIEVYRRRMEPTRSLLDFATFVAYFPPLVAGPIERAGRLLPRIQNPRTFPKPAAIRSALVLILIGLFKKVAVADSVSLIVDDVFGGGGDATAHLVGMYAFAIQIYCDFSGYSDMARGTSRLFGIEIMRNFEQPYLSRSITEFWRRWHISLSTWLHDYLYIPLGGNKRGELRTYVNLILTMLLGGLWHGANWTFVVWGGLHGVALAVHRWLGGYVPRGALPPFKTRQIPSILLTFHFVCLLWIFFRAPDIGSAWAYFGALFGGTWGPVNLDQLLVLTFGVAAVLALDISQARTGDHAVLLRWPRPIRGFAVAAFLLTIILWSGGEAQPFIYFQF